MSTGANATIGGRGDVRVVLWWGRRMQGMLPVFGKIVTSAGSIETAPPANADLSVLFHVDAFISRSAKKICFFRHCSCYIWPSSGIHRLLVSSAT